MFTSQNIIYHFQIGKIKKMTLGVCFGTPRIVFLLYRVITFLALHYVDNNKNNNIDLPKKEIKQHFSMSRI